MVRLHVELAQVELDDLLAVLANDLARDPERRVDLPRVRQIGGTDACSILGADAVGSNVPKCVVA